MNKQILSSFSNIENFALAWKSLKKFKIFWKKNSEKRDVQYNIIDCPTWSICFDSRVYFATFGHFRRWFFLRPTSKAGISVIERPPPLTT
jgi:hypothetical protein